MELTGVACRRGGRMLFQDVSLTLSAGEALLVTGANGSGKSSLLRIIAGLLRPSAGQVSREGRIAFADERHALDDAAPLSVALARWAALDRNPTTSLDAVGLQDLGMLPVRLLSTGQRRRAALARVMATGAPLWILDEPDLGLDAEGCHLLERRIAAHRAAGGAAIVASHRALDLPGAAGLRL
nr:heme ABC exporter ATP-binding protein CcmA [Sphingomonas jejuensis]